jgi:hypothetical protein
MPDYAIIPNFGQLTEFITQGPLTDGTYGIIINTVPLADHDLAGTTDTLGGDLVLKLQNILEDYVKVLAIKSRVMDLTNIQFNAVIPTAIRNRINAWLTARGWTNVPSGWTYKQLLNAIKVRL